MIEMYIRWCDSPSCLAILIRTSTAEHALKAPFVRQPKAGVTRCNQICGHELPPISYVQEMGVLYAVWLLLSFWMIHALVSDTYKTVENSLVAVIITFANLK